MARRTTVELVDDLHGSEGDERVTFSVDGSTYMIDCQPPTRPASAVCSPLQPRRAQSSGS